MADGNPRQNRGGTPKPGRSTGGKPAARKPAGGSGRGGAGGSRGTSDRSGTGRNASGKSGSAGSGGKSSGEPRRTDGGRSGTSGSGRAGGKPSGDSRGSDPRGRSGSGSSSSSRSGGRTGDAPKRTGSGGKPPYQKSGQSAAPRPRQREQLRVSGSGGGDLPRWIRDEVIRTTPKDRRDALLSLIGDAADAFANVRYTVARDRLLRAKAISTRSETVRELLGLSLYRLGNWEEALRELRAYRRIAGDTTHLAVEMDCLRALGRDNDVPKVWAMLRELGASKAAEVELRVVYGSFLLDQGRPRDAWKVTDPGRIHPDAHENDLRQWYVAARAAVALGDMKTADQLRKAIEDRDIAFPGLSELVNEINELR